MDLLQFISNTIESIIWPFTIFLLVIILKNPLKELLNSLTHLKYKNLEMDFQRLMDTAVNLPPSNPPVQQPAITDQAIYNSFENQLSDITQTSPSAAILLGWTGVETAMSSTVARLSISPDSPSYRSPKHNLDMLDQHANLPIEVAHTIDEMRMLRNKVAHDEKHRLNVSIPSAQYYGETAVKIIEYLNGI